MASFSAIQFSCHRVWLCKVLEQSVTGLTRFVLNKRPLGEDGMPEAVAIRCHVLQGHFRCNHPVDVDANRAPRLGRWHVATKCVLYTHPCKYATGSFHHKALPAVDCIRTILHGWIQPRHNGAHFVAL
eukprot:6492168-Amphidinium_carterae.4